MFYRRVPAGEGPHAVQRRMVPVDVTSGETGQVIGLGPDGHWGPRTISGDGQGTDYGPDIVDLLSRVQALEAAQVTVYLGVADGEYAPVTELWIDPETGNVSAITEEP